MIIVNHKQGTPEWHQHRANHNNASDAPAMLGVSPYRTRAELIKQKATGVQKDVDAATQMLFNRGHRAEEWAREIAEGILDEELYPCVGVLEGTKLSASLDGMTLSGVIWEHKLLNASLRTVMAGGCDGSDLPEHYRAQMEQQLLVSGATGCLFMASEWDEAGNCTERYHTTYRSDADMRQRIINGWAQFDADVAAYQPEPEVLPPAVGRAPDQLPALHIEVTGMVTASNLATWKDAAIAVFQGIGTDLQTDQDFADAEKTVKWCGEIEDQLKAAKAHTLSQTASIDELFRTIDAISAEARSKRLELDKLVKVRKESLKTELVAAAAASVRAHYDAINATLGQYRISPPQSLQMDLGATIKGKKTISSMRDALDAAVASAKIDASQNAERIHANIEIIDAHADHAGLMPDAVSLAHSKTLDDLRNLITARITEHQQREAARLEAERQRIRAEEEARAQAEVARMAQEMPAVSQVMDTVENQTAEEVVAAIIGHDDDGKPDTSNVTIALGQINQAIAPLRIDAAGLESLGFTPVDTKNNFKLYRLSDLSRICAALIKHLQGVTAVKDAA